MPRRTRIALAIPLSLALLAGSACNEVRTQLGSSQTAVSEVPLFDGMGPHKRKITTSSEKAQRYFDQGLTWAYAFNHDEAQRSFEEAARLDPECAMAYWGIALVNGPHINNPMMTEERSRIAWDAIVKAQEKAPWGKGTPAERGLIAALKERYANPNDGKIPLTFEERADLDKAYARAMEALYAEHKDDPDIGTLYAESLMDLRPWDLWDKNYNPRPETPKILATLEHVLSIDPNNPGANHLYIHACEASNRPDKANAAADRLRTLVPASGHLIHMPGHIDVRVGRWDQAAEQNRQANKADEKYREISPRQGFYRLYMAHNDHFLAWTCMMLGRKDEALAASRSMVSEIPQDWLAENAPIADTVAAIEPEVLVRFGEWDEVLKLEKPPEILPITVALWHFARATALNAKDQRDDARKEQEAFRKAAAAVPQDAMMAINPAHDVLRIADLVLDAEILFRSGDSSQAVEKLHQAAALEDQLSYMEPPDWIQPVRHALGAVLMDAKRYDEAEAVYRKDLEVWPENGWSLYGLAESLKAQAKPEEADVRKRFDKAWQHADTQIAATCKCAEKN